VGNDGVWRDAKGAGTAIRRVPNISSPGEDAILVKPGDAMRIEYGT
jgi:hypothetical protein